MPTNKSPEAAATPPREQTGGPVPHGLASRGTKRKVSLTIDESLLEEIRALAGDRPVSAVVNDLLAKAVAQDRLRQLVEELEEEAGPVPREVYGQILEEWERGAKK